MFHAGDIFGRHLRGMSSHPVLNATTTRPSRRSRDIRWFCGMGAGQTDNPIRLTCAIVISRWSWVPLVAVLGSSVAFRSDSTWPVMQALLLATLLQVLVKRVANKFSLPRPFAIGLCANHLGHSDRGGMPSTHAAVMGCLAGALSPWMAAWPEIALLHCICLMTAWARVCAGAHFPSDVLAGLLLGFSVGYVASQAFLLT